MPCKGPGHRPGYSENSREPEPDILQQLLELKSKIPNVSCKGFCWRACASISMTRAEHQAIEDRHGIHILHLPASMAVKHNMGATCAALRDGRCVIHEDKEAYPAICSAWGAVEHMRCPFGCVPEGGEWMSVVEYKLLIADMEDIGGGWDTTPMDRIRLRQLLSTRTGRERYTAHVMEEMAPIEAWWANYIETNPDNLMLGVNKPDGQGRI